MDAYDSATNEQKIELLKNLKFVWEYSFFSTALNQTNRHRKWKLETLLKYQNIINRMKYD